MRVITFRTTSDNALISFGPDNGMYDPGSPPPGARRSLEADYDAVLKEWRDVQAALPPPVDKKARFLANPAVPQWFKDYLSD